jgi:hypothetical protein
MEYMLASQIFHGVQKSGSPTPSEMTSSIVRARSKNFLIPEGGIVFARFEMKSFIAIPHNE